MLKKNNFVKYSGTSQQGIASGPRKMSAIERCSLHRGLDQIGTFTSVPAPKCIGTSHPYSPIGLPFFKLVKSKDQRQCVITTPYI